MADTVTTQRMLSESPEVEAYKLNLLKRASELATSPTEGPSFAEQLPGYQVADFTDPQMKAIEAARTTGIGSYMPYIQGANVALGGAYRTAGEAADILRGADTRGQFTDAQAAIQQAGSAAKGMTGGIGQLQQAITQLGGAAQGYDPSRAQAFMNPYQQQVIDAAMQQIQRQGDIAKQGAAAQAVRSGAFGSTREGVQRAEMERGILEQKANTMANLMAQGYSQAQANAMASFEQQQQRQLAGGQAQVAAGQTLANIYGQQAGQLQNIGMGIGQLAGQQFGIGQQQAMGLGSLASQLGQLGIQQGALGQTAQAMQQGDINFLYNIGQAQQNMAQQKIDAARATETQRLYAPYQQAAFLSDIYRGAPSTQMATTAASQPTPSPFQQAAGLAIGAGTAYLGAKKAGLFGP